MHVVLTWGLVLPTLFIRNVSVGPLTIGYNAGDTDNYSWYKLGGFTFQPTELAKISFILTFAMHLNNVRSHINEPKELAKLLLHLLVPIAIIHVQGDDGTAIIYQPFLSLRDGSLAVPEDGTVYDFTVYPEGFVRETTA